MVYINYCNVFSGSEREVRYKNFAGNSLTYLANLKRIFRWEALKRTKSPLGRLHTMNRFSKTDRLRCPMKENPYAFHLISNSTRSMTPEKKTSPSKSFELVDFAQIPPTPCPCGSARRAFADVEDFPATVHVTEISSEAKLHYHKRLTETYYFLECEPDAQMELDDEIIPVKQGMSIMIRPGTRHRALGKMKVLILVLPKFDPSDEWFD